MSTDNRTEVNDCDDDTTNFSTTGSSANQETSTTVGEYFEGTAAVGYQHSNVFDDTWTTTDSAGVNLNIDMSDVTVYILSQNILIDTYANLGLMIVVGDGTDRIGYQTGGNDAPGVALSSYYSCFKLDINEAAANPGTSGVGHNPFNGTEANLDQTAISQVGVGTLHLAKAKGNANARLDRMTYIANGSYALTINGGTIGTPETMADVQGDDETNGWGMIANPLGQQYIFAAPTEWGNSAATADVYFLAENEQWFWVGDNAGGRAVGATHFPFRVVGNATDTISFVLDNVVIVNTGTRAQFDMSDADVDIVQLDSVTFTDIGAITMPTQVANDKYCNNSIFNNCDQVDLQSLDCLSLTFNGTTDANGAIIWNADDNSEQNQDDLTFNSDGTGHAIYIDIDTASATVFDIDGYTFDGYSRQDGTAGNRVFLINNPSDGAITINVTNTQATNPQAGGTGETISYELAAGTTSTVSIVQSVSVTITVQDVDGNPIQGAKVFLEETGGTDIISFDTTNASGQVTASYSGSTPQTVVGYVAKGTTTPVYKRANINDTISATGLSATITMVADE